MNKAYLRSNNSVPPLFWKKVDNITLQIMHLLIPVYAIVEKEAITELSDICDIYQELHSIVAQTGYLSIAFRISTKITVIEWTRPGEPYTLDQVCLASRTPPSSDKTRSRKSSRCTRVMISLAPKVTRYSPKKSRSVEGQTLFTVMKPHVTCYLGRKQDGDDNANVMSLPDYVQKVRLQSSYRLECVILACLLPIFAVLVLRLAGYSIPSPKLLPTLPTLASVQTKWAMVQIKFS